jgi:hypothetical protein
LLLIYAGHAERAHLLHCMHVPQRWWGMTCHLSQPGSHTMQSKACLQDGSTAPFMCMQESIRQLQTRV